MKYEQEDLLEKFIQNEKKSKFWALLSAIAFTLIAITVVYVAKEVKGNSTGNNNNNSADGDNKTDTIFKTDTVLLAANDNKGQLKYLRDSFAKVQRDKEKAIEKLQIVYKECDATTKKLQEEIEKLKIVYRECSDKYKTVYEEAEKLRIKLKECEKKPDPPMPPVSKSINVVINYTGQVPDTTVNKLEKLLGKVKMNISRVKVQRGLKPVIMYFNADDEKIANYIATIINNPASFRATSKYGLNLNANGSKPAGNIEIWLTGIY